MVEQSLGSLNLKSEIEMSDKVWKFDVQDIADHKGITTKLDQNIWLDWHNVFDKPQEARMHMFPGKPKDVSLGIKRLRMETWQAAILVFDTIMVDVKSSLSTTEIKKLLNEVRLPRPERVILPTQNPSLMRLLGSFGFPKVEREYIATWTSFVKLAREGAIVRPKRYFRDFNIT